MIKTLKKIKNSFKVLHLAQKWSKCYQVWECSGSFVKYLDF